MRFEVYSNPAALVGIAYLRVENRSTLTIFVIVHKHITTLNNLEFVIVPVVSSQDILSSAFLLLRRCRIISTTPMAINSKARNPAIKQVEVSDN